MKFKENNSFEERAEQSRKILKKFPERVPVIVERAAGGKALIGQLDKSKFLLPHDATVAGFMANIRKQVLINSSDGFYMFCGDKNVLVSGSNHPSISLISFGFNGPSANSCLIIFFDLTKWSFGVCL